MAYVVHAVMVCVLVKYLNSGVSGLEHISLTVVLWYLSNISVPCLILKISLVSVIDFAARIIAAYTACRILMFGLSRYGMTILINDECDVTIRNTLMYVPNFAILMSLLSICIGLYIICGSP